MSRFGSCTFLAALAVGCGGVTNMPALQSPVVSIVGHPPGLPPVPDPPPPPPPPPAPKAVLGAGVVELLEPPSFGDKNAELAPESSAVLDQVAGVLQDNPWITRLSIQVHTDRNGSGSENRKLANQRAAAVFDYLVDKGVARTRLSTKGWGEARPLNKEKTLEADIENRRIELIIVEGEAPADADPTRGISP